VGGGGSIGWTLHVFGPICIRKKEKTSDLRFLWGLAVGGGRGKAGWGSTGRKRSAPTSNYYERKGTQSHSQSKSRYFPG